MAGRFVGRGRFGVSLLCCVSQEGRWNDSPCNQSLPSICKKAGRLSQGAAEEDHGCRKVRVFLELPKVESSPRGFHGGWGEWRDLCSLAQHPPSLWFPHTLRGLLSRSPCHRPHSLVFFFGLNTFESPAPTEPSSPRGMITLPAGAGGSGISVRRLPGHSWGVWGQ